MKIVPLAIIAAIVLSGCTTTASVPPTPVTTPVSLSAAQQKAVQEGVRGSLKDPNSAMFRGQLRAARSEEGVTFVCGVVNAKNSYGGYTGDKPFIGGMESDGKFIVAGMGGTDTESLSVISVCQKYGIVANG